MNKIFTYCLIIFSCLGCECALAQPLIVAHRGASAYAPENTIAAFKKALELGADALELDLRQTSDSVLVVLHDTDVERTTNGKGNVKYFSFEELQKLDAGSWFDKKFSDEKIPSLREVIDLLDDSTLIIIELKEGNETYPGIEERVVELVNQNNIESQTILKSFDPNVLKRLRILEPDIPLLYVYALRIPWLGMIIDRGVTFDSVYDLDVEYLQPHRFFLSQSFVNDAQSKSFKIISWGVNSTEAINESFDFGVDGIETDYPDKVLGIINEIRNGSDSE
ncbi:MAG: glycerophosphodiester phosphodiesterase [bacterium]|nr:glycerophosphodiester phosphodiesterase [bacterium]